MRRSLLALVLLFIATAANAQVIRRGSFSAGEPTLWISAGAGLGEGWTVIDGATGSRWQFSNATQYQASIERMFTGASFGVRGTTAMVPLSYNGADADARVSQLFAAVHVAPSRPGFHTVLELDAGATMYSGFRDRSSGLTLPPNSDADFSFAFGYGFGYGFSRAFSVEVVRDVTMTLHQKTGLSAGDDSSARINSTRLVGRFGLGS